jgi:hypothetical protein
MTRPAALIAAELGALLADQPGPLALLRELLSSDASRDASRDMALEARRAADRARQKTQRNKRNAAKQTMGSTGADVQESSRDPSVTHCDLSSLPFSEKGHSRKKGTRITQAQTISGENHSYAAREGIPTNEIARVWDEFVDYWSAVPGQRGCKLDWDATFRNRVRQLTPWKGKGHANGTGTRTMGAALDDLIARAEGGTEPPSRGPRDIDG